MVALVFIPGTSNGELAVLLKVIEKVSPPLLFMITSSFLAVLSISAKRCLAWEYENVFISIIPTM